MEYIQKPIPAEYMQHAIAHVTPRLMNLGIVVWHHEVALNTAEYFLLEFTIDDMEEDVRAQSEIIRTLKATTEAPLLVERSYNPDSGVTSYQLTRFAVSKNGGGNLVRTSVEVVERHPNGEIKPTVGLEDLSIINPKMAKLTEEQMNAIVELGNRFPIDYFASPCFLEQDED